jgi:hypothetical protein
LTVANGGTGASTAAGALTNLGVINNVTTNLSEGTATSTTVNVNSSDGTNATLQAATTSRAGVMTAQQVTDLAAAGGGGGGGGTPKSYSCFNSEDINIGDNFGPGGRAPRIDYIVATTINATGDNVALFGAEDFVDVVGRVTIRIDDISGLNSGGLYNFIVKIWQNDSPDDVTLGDPISNGILKPTSVSRHTAIASNMMSPETGKYIYLTIATIPVKMNLANGRYISMTAQLDDAFASTQLTATYVPGLSASMQITKVIAYDSTKEQTDY